VDGFDVFRFSTKPLGRNLHLTGLNRVLSVFCWAHDVRMLRADVISGHDITALMIGYLSCWYKPKSKRPKLVYDSHEFELGRDPHRSKLKLLMIKHLERFLMNQCAFSIMVNDTIADEVQRIHRLGTRPLVVRSTPNYWNIDHTETEAVRLQWLQSLSLPPNTKFFMYHGIVKENRGIELLLKTVRDIPGTAAVVLGNATDTAYLSSLEDLCAQYRISGRVIFMPAVPLEELWKYVGASYAGLIAYSTAVKNYYYLLPNKIFENIQAETPVICFDCPEMKKLVEKYDVGIVTKTNDANGVKEAAARMLSDKNMYGKIKSSLVNAKNILCWEKERYILTNAYSQLLNGKE